MKRLIGIGLAAVLSAGLLAGCAGAGGDSSLVGPGEAHAVISTALPPPPKYFHAQIVWLDGKYLSNQKRGSYWISPGRHKIGFRALLTSRRGPNLLSTPATDYRTNLPTLTLDLKAGYTYYFAAEVPPSGIPSQWHPILIKKERIGK
jgi:hypothetical protein